MADILIDNWTLQRAAVSISNVYDRIAPPNIEYAKLIDAIILYDNLYYIDNEFSDVWKSILWRFGYSNYLTPINREKHTALAQAESLAQSVSKEYTDIITQGAIEYSIISNSLGINYLPVAERANALESISYSQSFYNRTDVIAYLDKKIGEYYESIIQRFGSNKLSFQFPVLFDFVREKASKPFLIDTALQIRCEPQVHEFRNWMNLFEKELINGNLNEVERVMQLVPKIIDELTSVVSKKIMFTLELSVAPSIALPVSLGASPKKRFAHIDFLKTLADFALHNRSPLKF